MRSSSCLVCSITTLRFWFSLTCGFLDLGAENGATGLGDLKDLGGVPGGVFLLTVIGHESSLGVSKSKMDRLALSFTPDPSTRHSFLFLPDESRERGLLGDFKKQIFLTLVFFSILGELALY